MNTQSCRRENDPGGDRSYTASGIPREMVGSRILVVDTVTGTVEEPFPAGSSSWGAQWSPDGTKLAAYIRDEGAPCLGLWERTSGSYRLYSHVLVRPFFGFEVPKWTPDSQSLLLKLIATSVQNKREMVEEAKERHTGPATVFSFIPELEQESGPLPGSADGFICDLARVDIATGAVQQLAENWRLIGWKVAPDGHAVAVMRYTEADQKLQQFYYDLTVLSLHDGSPRLLARRVPQGGGVAFNWSPDSRFIAYITKERGTRDRLFVGLRRLGKQVELRHYKGEGHWPGRWSERSYRNLCERVLAWFDEQLNR